MSFLRTLTPTRKMALIGGAVLAAMLVAGWMFVLTPRADAVDAAKQQIKVAAAANDALRGQIATRRAQQEKLPELRKVEKALSGRFPPTAEQAHMFKMITAAAGRAGLAPGAVSNLTVTAPTSGLSGGAASAQLPGIAPVATEVAAQQVTLDVKGTAAQIRSMVANLEDLPRAFELTTLSLTDTDETSDVQTGSITGQMFLLPKLEDPTVAASAASGSSAKRAGS